MLNRVIQNIIMMKDTDNLSPSTPKDSSLSLKLTIIDEVTPYVDFHQCQMTHMVNFIVSPISHIFEKLITN